MQLLSFTKWIFIQISIILDSICSVIQKKCHPKRFHNDIKYHMTLNTIFSTIVGSPFVHSHIMCYEKVHMPGLRYSIRNSWKLSEHVPHQRQQGRSSSPFNHHYEVRTEYCMMMPRWHQIWPSLSDAMKERYYINKHD